MYIAGRNSHPWGCMGLTWWGGPRAEADPCSSLKSSKQLVNKHPVFCLGVSIKAETSLKSGVGFSIAPPCQLMRHFDAAPRRWVPVPLREARQQPGKWERQAWLFLDSSHPQTCPWMQLRVCMEQGLPPVIPVLTGI